jgi:hypothetical protein
LGEYWGSGLPVVLSEGVGDECTIIEELGLGITLDFECPSAFHKGGRRLLDLLEKSDNESAVELRSKCNVLRGRPIVSDAYAVAYGTIQQALNGTITNA